MIFAQIEKEILAIVFASEKFEKYILGMMLSMWKQTTSPWREFLTGVFVTHLQDCNECFTHFSVRILKLDTLSISMKQHLEKSLKLVDHIETLRVSPRPQEQMEKDFSQDQVCKSLKQVILEGWPGNTRECDPVPHLFKFQVQVSVCLPFFSSVENYLSKGT